MKNDENKDWMRRRRFMFISRWLIALIFIFSLMAVVSADECNDGVKGIYEYHVDCGGICPPCTPKYNFLGDYPSNRENAFSEVLQGIAHDKDNWYFTNREWIWKIPVTVDLNSAFSGSDPSRGILAVRMPEELSSCDDRPWSNYNDYSVGRYKHFGDLYYDPVDDLLFIPTEGEGCYYHAAPRPVIAVFRASDLTLLTYAPLFSQDQAGWCAINPIDEKLYTSNNQISPDNPMLRYTINRQALRDGKNYFLGTTGYPIALNSGSGTPMTIDPYLQGGEFSDDAHLYLIHGKDWDINEENFGIKVFETTTWKMVAKSTNGYGNFNYQFDDEYREEPEGLTLWDLDKDTRAPHIRGQLHAIMLDNDYTSPGSTDDLYLKHYRITTTPLKPRITSIVPDSGIAGTTVNPIHIYGSGFEIGAKVILAPNSANPVEVSYPQVSWVSTNELTLSLNIPANMAPSSNRPSLQSVIRVVNTDGRYADIPFSIVAKPALTLSVPNGGEDWISGSTQKITWSYTGDPGSQVRIVLYRGIKKGGLIADNVPIRIDSFRKTRTGSYSWTIPQDLATDTIYKVGILSTSQPTINDMSDNYFTITSSEPPSVRITSPNGGESWSTGTTKKITWSYTGDPGSRVKIMLVKYTIRGGIPIPQTTTIADNVPTYGGSYPWTILSNQALGTTYKIVVQSMTQPKVIDGSDRYFTINAGNPAT